MGKIMLKLLILSVSWVAHVIYWESLEQQEAFKKISFDLQGVQFGRS